MEGPHPGGTAFVITVSPEPGKYELLGSTTPLNRDNISYCLHDTNAYLEQNMLYNTNIYLFVNVQSWLLLTVLQAAIETRYKQADSNEVCPNYMDRRGREKCDICNTSHILWVESFGGSTIGA